MQHYTFMKHHLQSVCVCFSHSSLISPISSVDFFSLNRLLIISKQFNILILNLEVTKSTNLSYMKQMFKADVTGKIAYSVHH